MPVVAASASGLLFGLGLILSGMADASKVLGFLDLAAAWDPSLALVMAGAIAVGTIGFAHAGRRRTSLLSLAMQLPPTRGIDARLIGGSLLFRASWGIAGSRPDAGGTAKRERQGAGVRGGDAGRHGPAQPARAATVALARHDGRLTPPCPR